MNKRQKKKRRNKFIALNGFPQQPFREYQCPYCGFDIDSYTSDELIDIGGSCNIKDYRAFFNGDYSGHTWTEIVKCPICKTKFEYENSDV